MFKINYNLKSLVRLCAIIMLVAGGFSIAEKASASIILQNLANSSYSTGQRALYQGVGTGLTVTSSYLYFNFGSSFNHSNYDFTLAGYLDKATFEANPSNSISSCWVSK